MHWAEKFSSLLNRKARYTKRNPSAIILHKYPWERYDFSPKWVECSPMAWETWVQSQVALYFIRYVSRVKWSNPGKAVALSLTSWCSSNWKRSHLDALDYDRQLYLLVKYYHYYSSTSTALVLNIPRRLTCHKTKKPKKNEIFSDILLSMFVGYHMLFCTLFIPLLDFFHHCVYFF